MLIPPYLKKGNTIAITCPSGYLEKSKIEHAVQTFGSWGMKVIVGKTVGSNSTNYFSGTDEERWEELQCYLDDDNIHAVIMGRGGYGMSRIIDRLNFRKFKKHPKWICGFSDITLLHNHLQSRLKIASIHGPMCAAYIPKGGYDPGRIADAVRKMLTGKKNINYPIPLHPANRAGKAEGILVGGNLAMITHGIGSPSEIQTKGNILFLEDIGEHLYKIDRMLLQLKRAGLLDHLAGVILGQFSDSEDTTRPFGSDLETILSAHFAAYDYPVCRGFPAGHDNENFPLKFGSRHRLIITKRNISFKEV